MNILDKLFQKRVIVNCEREPYLHRWFVIRTEVFGLFIHKFVRSDEDRCLHDHPWNFIVMPIWRGYIEHSERALGKVSLEERWACAEYVEETRGDRKIVGVRWPLTVQVKRRVYPILGTRFRPATYRHRVELIDSKPSWSVFIRFKKLREWGFWPKTGFVQWNTWWQKNCE